MLSEGGASPVIESPPTQILDDFFRRKQLYEVCDSVTEEEFSMRCALVRRYHQSFAALADHYLEYLGSLGAAGSPPGGPHVEEAYRTRHNEHAARMSPPKLLNGQRGLAAASPDRCTVRSDVLAHSFEDVETPFDLSLALHRKDVRLRAMERVYDEERRRTETFRMREHKRTVAVWRRAEQQQKKAVSRTVTEGLKHSSYVDRERQRDANERRQVQRGLDEATRSRKELLETQRRSRQQAKMQSERMAREAVQRAAYNLQHAKAELDKDMLATLQTEGARKEQGIRVFDSATKRLLYKRKMYEETFKQINASGADKLDRDQLASFGDEDRSHIVNPLGFKATVRLPVRELTRTPKFMDPASSPSSVRRPAVAGPMDARTYDRLCNVGSPLSAPALRNVVWGSASSPSDMSSYYMVRAPPTVGWKR